MREAVGRVVEAAHTAVRNLREANDMLRRDGPSVLDAHESGAEIVFAAVEEAARKETTT